MKRMTALFLATLLLAVTLTACTNPAAPMSQMLNPADLYYCKTEVCHGIEDGVIGAQTVDLGETPPELDRFLQVYLSGPTEQTLESPFPTNTEVQSVTAANNTVTVQLGGAYAELSGIQATVADACLARTLLDYTGAEKILLTVADDAGQTLRSRKIAHSDILLFDDSSDTSSVSFTLYFTDSHARYLIPERRTVPYMTAAELPKYVIGQLIAGPETNGLQSTLPDGTRLLDINVDSGVCAVDFSADFLNNRPQTTLGERLTVLSIANTLTELDSIEQVQFYVEGRRQELFSFLDLSGSFVSDGTAVGPVREDLNELDAALFLPVNGQQRLYEMPVRLKTGNAPAAEAVLHMLCTYEPKNGLSNPLFEKPLPVELRIRDGCCTLDYPEGMTFGDSAEAEQTALRSVAASLTALDGIESIQIYVNHAPAVFSYCRFDDEITPAPDWYCSEPMPSR